MKGYSLEYLMSEINDTVKMPNVESLRMPVLSGVRECFRKIGYNLVSEVRESFFEVKDYTLRIPDEMIRVHDVSLTPSGSGAYDNGPTKGYKMGYGQHKKGKLVYYESPFELKFDDYKKGGIFLSGFYFYKDDKGSLIIPEAAYFACLAFCEAHILFKLTLVKHPRWQDRYNMKNDAEAKIFECRGDLNNQTSLPSQRSLRG